MNPRIPFPLNDEAPEPIEWARYEALYKKCLTTGGMWHGQFSVTGFQRNQLTDGRAAVPTKRLLIAAFSSRYFSRAPDMSIMAAMNDSRWTMYMTQPNQCMAYKFINCPNIPVVQATTDNGAGNYIRGQVPGFRFQFGFKYDNYLRKLPTDEQAARPPYVPGEDPQIFQDASYKLQGLFDLRDRWVYYTPEKKQTVTGYQFAHPIYLIIMDCSDPSHWCAMNDPSVNSEIAPIYYNIDAVVQHRKRTLFYQAYPYLVDKVVTVDDPPETPRDWGIIPLPSANMELGPEKMLADVWPPVTP